MPEHCRVGVCGFDPMIVKGYLKTGERALWWHVSDELYEQYKPKPSDTVSGTLLAIYGPDGQKVATPNEPFEWKCARETGLAVLLPPDFIGNNKLTEFHFLELVVEKVGAETVFPGEQKVSTKMWPEDKMKLDYKIAYL
jgi:hypothetical protein